MAASGWTYFVPYQSDPEQALQELRNGVFTRKEYTRPGDILKGWSDEALSAAMPLADMKKMLKIAKSLSEAMKAIGFDTEMADKDTRGVERMVQRAEKQGIAKAVREETGGNRKKEPKSIDQALRLAGEDGTHSILDIHMTSVERKFGCATPLTSDELISLFGTDKPTCEAAREKDKAGELSSLREVWEAAYFTVYHGDQPAEIVFCGSSGD